MSLIFLDFRPHTKPRFEQQKAAKGPMLSFNLILRAHGFEPTDVRLVRHADRHRRSDGQPIQPLLVAAFRSDPTAFEFYQRMQAEPIFGDSKYLAAFLAMPNRKTVFTGIWTINGYRPNTEGLRCAITGKDEPDKIIYDLTKLPTLSKFEGRLAIDWGASERTWVQYADRRDKEIASLSDPEDPAFPGWRSFSAIVKDTPALPLSWQAILASARGVYLLVHRPSGQQYVGSAIGARGFLSRWLDYAATDHGGNLNLKGKSAADLDVVVLEAASSAATDDDILQAESAWKAKLGTRVHGLNAN